jgi:HK97 family phage prohead protease
MPNPPTENLLRAWSAPDAMEYRDGATGDGNTLHGHFAVFNSWTEINSAYEGQFVERVAPGAFAKTFAERGMQIKVLFDHGHDPSIGNKPLGEIKSLAEDRTGAAYEVGLFDTSYVNDLRPALRSGQLGASFRFRVDAETWNDNPKRSADNVDGLRERTIDAATVYEFGPVAFPAYSDASAGLRSTTDQFIERLLADPVTLARFIDRTSPRVVEHLLAERDSIVITDDGDIIAVFDDDAECAMCDSCGSDTVPADANFCPDCGTAMPDTVPANGRSVSSEGETANGLALSASERRRWISSWLYLP